VVWACQTGQTPLSIADRLGFSAAAETLRPVTSRRAVLSPGATHDDAAGALMILEPEMMLDLDFEDDAGTDHCLHASSIETCAGKETCSLSHTAPNTNPNPNPNQTLR